MSAAAVPCLRVPEFLGVHTIALGEELALDAGALLLVTGAAAHNDQGAQLLSEQLQERLQQGGLDGSADHVGTRPTSALGHVLNTAKALHRPRRWVLLPCRLPAPARCSVVRLA